MSGGAQIKKGVHEEFLKQRGCEKKGWRCGKLKWTDSIFLRHIKT